MDRSVLAGVAAFRWLAWIWMSTVLFFDRRSLARSWLAYGLVALALAGTIALTLALRRSPPDLTRPPAVLGELVCGCLLFLAGGWAYAPAGFAASQSLGVAWPLAGVLSAAVAFGATAGVVAGVVVAASRVGGELLNHVPAAQLVDGRHLVSTLTPVVLFAMAGASVGYLATLLRRAGHQVAVARARAEMARALHDGVLQTLTLVERQTADPALARLARDQERDLRAFLRGDDAASPGGGPDLAGALRSVADRFERSFPGRVAVLVADDLPSMSPAAVGALAGAVGEALTNAGKHGAAAHVTVYAEPDESERLDGRRRHVFCSVKDDGAGFDPSATPEGMGIASSIRARVEEVGGRVEVAARPGWGAEIRLWV